jgi:hypothetical protein
MSLSCSCEGEYWPEEYGETAWWLPDENDVTTLQTKRRKRCKSCNELINIGEECTEIHRERMPYNEIEARITGAGDDVLIPVASWYLCERCGDIYSNLSSLGYCMDLASDNMEDLLIEYHKITGFKR